MTWTDEMTALEEVGALGMGLGCSCAIVSRVERGVNSFALSGKTRISNYNKR